MRLVDNRSRVTYGSPISERLWLDTNGQLICRDAIIARTGSYDYLESEILQDGDNKKIVKVFRTDDEVFNPTAIASFENKPFVDDHPQEDVSPENFRELSKGYMRDVRRGTGELSNCLICDIVVTDPETIEEIRSGRKRELSLGYDTNIVRKDGKYIMTNIRGNHLALVDSGRAGCATIRDSAKEIKKSGGLKMKNSRSKVTLFDEDIYEVEEITEQDDDIEETFPVDEEVKPEVTDAEPTLADIFALLQKIDAKLPDTVKDDEEVKEEITETPTEETTEEEVVADDDEEIKEEAEVEEDVEDCGDELLDADECLTETKTKDARSVYKKFAKVTDASFTNASDVNKAFQDRYNQIARKSN